MYKNYIFDLYGTIVDLYIDEDTSHLWKNMALFFSYNNASCFSSGLKDAYFKEVTEQLYNETYSAWSDVMIENVFKELYKKMGVKANEDLITQTTRLFRVLSTNDIGLYDHVIEVLEELKKAGKKLFIFSNGQRGFSIPEMKYLGIYDFFDGIYFSSDMGICKPDEKYFKHLITKEKIKINESVLIGNDYDVDYLSSEKVGMDHLYIFSNLSGHMPLEIKSKYKILDGDFSKILRLTGV